MSAGPEEWRPEGQPQRDIRMQPPRAYADIAGTELARAEAAPTLTARQFHQANAQVWAQLALAAGIERGAS